MKKVILGYAIAAICMIACNNSNKSEADRSYSDLRSYVDTLQIDNPDYYMDDSYWPGVEKTFEEKSQQVEARKADLNEEQRKEYEQLREKYNALKTKYNSERERVKVLNNRRVMLRNALFGEGVIGEDMSFAFMNAKNAAAVYENFVTVVNNSREEYSREDWDEIKVLYEAMDTRKNQVEKQITSKDNRIIAGQKIKFTAIKAVNRPFSKMEENSEAKEDAAVGQK